MIKEKANKLAQIELVEKVKSDGVPYYQQVEELGSNSNLVSSRMAAHEKVAKAIIDRTMASSVPSSKGNIRELKNKLNSGKQ